MRAVTAERRQEFDAPVGMAAASGRHVFWLAVVLLAAAGVRLFQAARLGCISRDGVEYVAFAQRMAVDPVAAVNAWLLQPGYPAVVLVVHRVCGGLLSADPVLAWERSGQLAALLGGVISVWLIYLLTARLFDRTTGCIAAALAAMWPQAIELSADVLTDMPHLALYLAALLLAERGLRGGRAATLGAAGFLSGIAYLVRQEALVLVLAALACRLWPGAERRWRVRLLGSAALVMAFALPVAPYAAATGKLMHKKSIRQLLESGAEARQAAAVDWLSAPLHAAEGWARSGRYVFSTLAVIAVLWRRVPRSDRSVLRLLMAVVALHLLAVWLRGRSFGEISSRYMLIPAALTIPWSAAALRELCTAAWTRRPMGRATVLGLLVLTTAPLVWPLRQAPNHDSAALREAGMWLRAHARPEDEVLAPGRLKAVCFYADLARVWPRPTEPDVMWQNMRLRAAWFADLTGHPRWTEAERAFLEHCRREWGDAPVVFEGGLGGGRVLRIVSLEAHR
jgi:4-amino-4-deoxy-L-arabinose transferase-like glycosyltransferase